jgi:dethiobiotin synthetase
MLDNNVCWDRYPSMFVTGNDTGIGKTLISALIAKYFLDQGQKTITQKWIQTGAKPGKTDIDFHRKAMGQESVAEEIKGWQMPYAFKCACAPHLAAKEEKVVINKDKIIKAYRHLEKAYDKVVIEGVGGLLVPINNKELVIDLVSLLKIPVLVVIENRIGTINQALLVTEAIRRRGLELIGIIFNEVHKTADKKILRDNMEIVQKLVNGKILGMLSNQKNVAVLYEELKNILSG